MDHRNVREKNSEVDIESGLPVIEDDPKKASTPDTAKQVDTLFAKISGGLVGGSIKSEDRRSLCCNDSNLSRVSVDVMQVTNKSLVAQNSVDPAEKIPLKEKCKSASNKKKAPKPPRPPRAPSLDAADQKLVREISELAMLKRARIEQMKALKKIKAAKPSSSTSSSVLAMVFTVVFCIVIILQG